MRRLTLCGAADGASPRDAREGRRTPHNSSQRVWPARGLDLIRKSPHLVRESPSMEPVGCFARKVHQIS